jgi:TonB family protein
MGSFARRDVCDATSSSGWPFYFPMLDGVTAPKPVKTSTFPYPASYKPVILSGNVVISKIVITDGNVEQARIVQKVDPDFDSDTLKAISTWHFEPAKSPDGTPVPIRLGIQLRFGVKGRPAQALYPEDELVRKTVGTVAIAPAFAVVQPPCCGLLMGRPHAPLAHHKA